MATVATVIAQVKWQADRQRGGRLVTADLIPVANLVYKEAWDILIASGEEYFIKTSAEFTLTGGSSSFSYDFSAVISDFYKLKAVQAKVGTYWSEPLQVYAPGRRQISYRLESSVLYLEPQDGCAGTYRFRYVYKPPDLTAVGDAIVDVNGWVEQYMVQTMTILVRDREEEDSSLLQRLRQGLEARIQKMAVHRAGARKVANVRKWWWMPWRRLPEDP